MRIKIKITYFVALSMAIMAIVMASNTVVALANDEIASVDAIEQYENDATYEDEIDAKIDDTEININEKDVEILSDETNIGEEVLSENGELDEAAEGENETNVEIQDENLLKEESANKVDDEITAPEEKCNDKEEEVTGSVSIINVNTISGVYDVIVAIASNCSIEKILVPTWSQSGQSDIIWYVAEIQSDGVYRVHVDIAAHGFCFGTYQSHAYAVTDSGNMYFLGAGSTTFTKSTPVVSVNTTDDENYTVSAIHIPGTLGLGLTEVKFAVWSVDGGQDDLVWYNGSLVADSYCVMVPLNAHGYTQGKYIVHIYASYINGITECVSQTSFEVVNKATVSVENVNNVSGVFDVVISDIHVAGGVKSILIPIWSESNQNDIKWYTAERQSDGTYITHVDVAYHNCNYGEFQIDVYAKNNSDFLQKIGHTTQKLIKSTSSIHIDADELGEVYTISIKGAPGTLGQSLKKVQVAVWNKRDQSDIKWYDATSEADQYIVNVPLSDFDSRLGAYQVHPYGLYSSGKQVNLGMTSFDINNFAEVCVTNVNNEAGTFDVVASNVSAVGGLKNVKIAIWSKSDQSDLKWYTAEKLSDGLYYVHMDFVNHNYNYGNFQVHTYVENGYGKMTCVDARSQMISKPEVALSMTSDNGSFTATISNIPGSGGSLKYIRVAIWSLEDDQDDLKWYKASDNNGVYVVTASYADHPSESGRYQIHVYATYADGSQLCVTTTIYSKTKTLDHYGIDVSQYQGYIDWTAVKASGVTYAIIRAVGYNSSSGYYEDTYFDYNMKAASAAGINVGMYIYSNAYDDSSAYNEAIYMVNLAKKYDVTMPIFIDIEQGHANNMTASQATSLANTFCNVINAYGYKAGVYSSMSAWIYKLNAGTLGSNYIWIAYYGHTLDELKSTWSSRCDIWQYSSKGSVNGVSGAVDADFLFF